MSHQQYYETVQRHQEWLESMVLMLPADPSKYGIRLVALNLHCIKTVQNWNF